MDVFVFSANIILPLFIIIMIGYLLRRIGVFNDAFLNSADSICFKVFLPVLLFYNIYKSDFQKAFDKELIIFMAVGVLVIILASMALVPLFAKSNARRGAIIQALFRGNYLIFGVAICQSIFGSEGAAIASMLAAFTIPLFNFAAVVVLSIYSKDNKFKIFSVIKKILLNPLIIASVLGSLAVVFKVQIPFVIEKSIKDISNIATPFALMVLGGTFKFSGLAKNILPVTFTTFVRLIVIPAAVIPIAVYLGFEGARLMPLIVVFCSPSAVSSYVMAKQMGADGDLAGQLVVVTSLVSIVTMFVIVYICKLFSLI